MTKTSGGKPPAGSNRRLFLVILTGGVTMVSFTLLMVLLPILPAPPLPKPVTNLRAVVLDSDLYVYHKITEQGGETETEHWVRKLFREGEVVLKDPAGSFHDGAVYRGQLWLFSEGSYRTFNGRDTQEFTVPWIGYHPSVASSDRRIWILSRRGVDLELASYSGGKWERPGGVSFPDGETARICSEACLYDLAVLNGRPHLLWVNEGRLYHWEWREDGTGKVRDLAPARDLEVLSVPDGLIVWFLPTAELARPGYQRVEMLRFDGESWVEGPGFERPNPASLIELSGVYLDGRIHLLVNNVMKVELLDFDGSEYRSIAVLSGSELGAIVLKFMAGFFILLVLIMTGMAGALSWTMNRWKHSDPPTHRLSEPNGDRGRGTGVAYATVWIRFSAKAIDTILIAVPLGALIWWKTDPVSFLFMGSASEFFSTGGRAFGLIPAALLIYHSILEGLNGRTPGKRLMGIRVVGTDGEPCGIRRAVLRNIFRFLDGIYLYGIGLISIAATERWQRIGDLIGRTIVVQEEDGTARK